MEKDKNGKPDLRIVAPPPGTTFHHQDDIVPPTPGIEFLSCNNCPFVSSCNKCDI